METEPHHLADDVFVCLSDGRFIFLDLHHDKYLCLNRRNSQAVTSLFPRFQGQGPNPLTATSTTDGGDIGAILAALANRGLLAKGEVIGKEAAPIRIQTPNKALIPTEASLNPRVRPSHLAAFLHSALVASCKLRLHSMRRTVQGVATRKRRRVHLRITDSCALRELIAIFYRLRPLYGREYLCLYDSLALLEFLAHYHRFPQWVFAVRSPPFAAHCWVQEDDCVLNDTVENTRGYTPIMVI